VAYLRRIERAIAQGFTASQGAGKPRTTELLKSLESLALKSPRAPVSAAILRAKQLNSPEAIAAANRAFRATGKTLDPMNPLIQAITTTVQQVQQNQSVEGTSAIVPGKSPKRGVTIGSPKLKGFEKGPAHIPYYIVVQKHIRAKPKKGQKKGKIIEARTRYAVVDEQGNVHGEDLTRSKAINLYDKLVSEHFQLEDDEAE
jgi:hypothetical protein